MQLFLCALEMQRSGEKSLNQNSVVFSYLGVAKVVLRVLHCIFGKGIFLSFIFECTNFSKRRIAEIFIRLFPFFPSALEQWINLLKGKQRLVLLDGGLCYQKVEGAGGVQNNNNNKKPHKQ